MVSLPVLRLCLSPRPSIRERERVRKVGLSLCADVVGFVYSHGKNSRNNGAKKPIMKHSGSLKHSGCS